MLSRKYLLFFFSFYFFVLFLIFVLLFYSLGGIKSADYFVIIPLLLFFVFIVFLMTVMFEGNGQIKLKYLRIGIYTAKKYWICENDVFIICCRGTEFTDLFARIILIKPADFADSNQDFFKSLEKDVPAQFFVTRYKKAKRKQIYSPKTVLDFNKYREFVLD